MYTTVVARAHGATWPHQHNALINHMKSFTLRGGAARFCSAAADMWPIQKSGAAMVAPCAKRQTVGLRSRRLGSVKGQEVLSSIPRADRFWTHPVAYARLPGATATTKKCPKRETDHQHPSVAEVKHALRFRFPRHVDDLACNLLYICDLQKIAKFYVITAHFHTSNNG